LLFLENGDILVVVLVTLNAVENPRGHVLSVELPRLDALKHILGGVEIVLRLFVRVVQLVFWVILEYRSTHNGGGKATLLRDQADD